MRPASALLATLSAASATLVLTFALAQEPGPPRAIGPFPPARAEAAAKAKNAPAARRQAEFQKAPAGVRNAVRVQKMMAPVVPVPRFQAMLGRCRPVLRAEFHIVRAACRPTPEQLKAVARAGEAALREVAKNQTKRPMTVEQQMAFDPRKLLQEGILKALPAILPAEKVALYEKDLARRAEARRRNSIRAIVAHLDRDLLLDAKQRAAIERSFSDNWDDHWEQSPQQFMNNSNFLYPVTPNRLAVPYLSASQATVWHDLPKGRYPFSFAVFNNAQQDPLEDPDLREARLEAEKREDNDQPGRNPQGEIPKPFRIMVEQMKQQLKAGEKAQRKP